MDSNCTEVIDEIGRNVTKTLRNISRTIVKHNYRMMLYMDILLALCLLQLLIFLVIFIRNLLKRDSPIIKQELPELLTETKNVKDKTSVYKDDTYEIVNELYGIK